MTAKKHNLNENETLAMEAICADCDDIDGYGFTRPASMVLALVKVFHNGYTAGGYIADLMEKNLIEVDVLDDTVWVDHEVYAAYC